MNKNFGKTRARPAKKNGINTVSAKPIVIALAIAAILYALFIHKQSPKEIQPVQETQVVAPVLPLIQNNPKPTQNSPTKSESAISDVGVSVTEESMTKEELKEMLDIKIQTLENKIVAGRASLDRQTDDQARKELEERISAAVRMQNELKKVNPADPTTWEFLKQMNTKTDQAFTQSAAGTADSAIDSDRNTNK